LCTTTSCNFNFYPGALFLFRKHVKALELGSCTSRRCTMQLNETQPESLTALLELNFCYQLQTALVPSDANLSCYSSAATTFYPTFVFFTYTDNVIFNMTECSPNRADWYNAVWVLFPNYPFRISDRALRVSVIFPCPHIRIYST
jgi:hypothetical protein